MGIKDGKFCVFSDSFLPLPPPHILLRKLFGSHYIDFDPVLLSYIGKRFVYSFHCCCLTSLLLQVNLGA